MKTILERNIESLCPKCSGSAILSIKSSFPSISFLCERWDCDPKEILSMIEQYEEEEIKIRLESSGYKALRPEEILFRKEDLDDQFSDIIKRYKEEIERASCRCAHGRIKRKFLAQIEEIQKK